MRDPNSIGGSGAYKFTQWVTNQQVILTKKENWWGDKLADKYPLLTANLKKLVYKVVKDENVVLKELSATEEELKDKPKKKNKK